MSTVKQERTMARNCIENWIIGLIFLVVHEGVDSFLNAGMEFRFCGVWLQEIWTSFYWLLVCNFQRNVKSFLLSSTSIKNKITVTRISIKTFYLDCFLKHFCNLLFKKSFSISMVAALFAVSFSSLVGRKAVGYKRTFSFVSWISLSFCYIT